MKAAICPPATLRLAQGRVPSSSRGAKVRALGLLVALSVAAAPRPSRAQEEPDPGLPEPPVVADGRTPDIDAIIDHFENMYRSKSSISRMEVTVVKPRRTRKLRMKVWTRGTERALIVIESPAREKGTATLKVEKNLWNYLPRISRTIRIPPSMMLGSWMGSDFTNDDLVRESSFREDYTYRFVGRSEDPPGWCVALDAKPGVVGLWKKMELTVSVDGMLPLKADYYDRKGRLARTITWSEVRDLGGRKVPALMVLTPHDKKKKGRRTMMRYLDIDFDVDVPESTFSLSRLERKR